MDQGYTFGVEDSQIADSTFHLWNVICGQNSL